MQLPKLQFVLALLLLISFSSCGDDNDPIISRTDSFDRKAMLTNWADHIIIPAFESYQDDLIELENSAYVFVTEASIANLNTLRLDYIDAYKSWQTVSLFDIGEAESIGLRNYTNIYPTDIEGISQNIELQNYNLELPSQFDTQGFPALDYLLYGQASTDELTLTVLSTEKQQHYLSELVQRLNELNSLVLNDWKNGYRAFFINNDAASATASIDKVVNDYLFYIEKYFRAGKVGIPSGVFTGNVLPKNVEAPYSAIYSKDLFLNALGTINDFFRGQANDSISEGLSLEDYLMHLNENNETNSIAFKINVQFENIEIKSQGLSDNFKEEITTNQTGMLELYDEIQKLIILLKVDMMQALNIQIDYVDADGD